MFEGIRIDHNHPILAAILTMRRKAATSFTPEHMGQRGEDFDAGLLAAYQAVEAALKAERNPHAE
jgi:hypothetical protein